jgi:hypothetical protein
MQQLQREHTLILAFVSHYQTHSEAWYVWHTVNGALVTSESFDARDGEHCQVSRHLFQGEAQAELTIAKDYADFGSEYMSQMFHFRRVY